MERETGIEPATNSLEGCDSTTELLPPAEPSPDTALSQARTWQYRLPLLACLDEAHGARWRPPSRSALVSPACQAEARQRSAFAPRATASSGLPAEARMHVRLRRHAATADSLRMACERRLVARGGFEPPKPLGRQIYSLLHLTALQPRQIACQNRPTGPPPTSRPATSQATPPPGAKSMELAKGFEPPTR
jgi:hypothetical protein